MPPRAATVWRAVTGVVGMASVGRKAGANQARGCAIHSDIHFETSLRRPRSRAGVCFKIRSIEP